MQSWMGDLWPRLAEQVMETEEDWEYMGMQTMLILKAAIL